MLSERAQRYAMAMGARYGADYLRDRYVAEDPVDYDPMSGRGIGRMPMEEWVEQEAFMWTLAQERAEPARPVRYDRASHLRERLQRLRERQEVAWTEDRGAEIEALSRALREEEGIA